MTVCQAGLQRVAATGARDWHGAYFLWLNILLGSCSALPTSGTPGRKGVLLDTVPHTDTE